MSSSNRNERPEQEALSTAQVIDLVLNRMRKPFGINDTDDIEFIEAMNTIPNYPELLMNEELFSIMQQMVQEDKLPLISEYQHGSSILQQMKSLRDEYRRSNLESTIEFIDELNLEKEIHINSLNDEF